MNLSKGDFLLFLNWLKSKNPSSTYRYTSPRNCLISQYLRDMGHENVSVNPGEFRTLSMGEGNDLPFPLDLIAKGGDSDQEAFTFGQAHDLAETEFKKMYG